MANYLKTLVPGTDPKIDIVAVHGLNPKGKGKHGEGTWTAPNGKLWLRDFLALKIPEARILLFGYDSSVFNGSTMHVTDHATNLLNRLENKRADAPERPVVFIVHSLGGLVVKQAMVEAKQTDNPIRSATHGIIFFGTPHKGGNKAGLGKVLNKIVNASILKPPSKLVEALEKESVFLEQLDMQFRNQLEDFSYVSFREQRPHPVVGIVVDDQSAQLGLPWKRERAIAIDRDHNGICKFESEEDGDYEQVEDEVKRFVKDAITSASLRSALKTPVLQQQQDNRRSTSIFTSPGLFGNRFSSPTLSEGLTSTDALSAPNRVFVLPSEHQIRNFVGRQDLLLRIISKLISNDAHHRIALYGLGGVGKSDFALRCAYDIKSYSTDISVFWISAGSIDQLQQSIQDIARALQITDATTSTSVLSDIRNHLDQRENGRWVMIIDHVDDLQNLGDLGSYIPSSSHGSVLFTTRNRKIATEVADKSSDERIGPLSQHECVELLYQLLDTDQIQDGSGVPELTQLLECFPQAIVQAASFMRKNDITVQTYLRSFSENGYSALELLGHGLEDSSTSTAVTTSWMASFKQLQANNEYAADLLSLMAFLNHRDIPEAVLLAMDDAKTARLFIQACGSLKAFSFISETPVQGAETLGSKIFHVQPMVQVVMQHWLRKHDQAARWCSAALVALSKVLGAAESSRDQWQVFDICLPHIQTVSKHMVDFPNEQELKATLLHDASWYFRIRGYHDTAEEMALEALKIRKQLLGEEHEATLASTHSLALILFEQNRINEAEALEMQAIDICKRAFSEDDNHILRHQSHLARIWGVQSKYEEALEVQQKIFASSMVDDPTFTNSATWSAMRDLAITLSYVGRQREAESLQLQVYKARSENLGKDHPETLVIMSDLATSYLEQARYQEAEELLKDMLPRSKQILGEKHPSTIAAYEDYRAVLRNLGDNKSLRMLDEVIRKMQRDSISPRSALHTKPTLKRTVSDSVVTYAYRTTQVARISRRQTTGMTGRARGLGLDPKLTGDDEAALREADDGDDTGEDDAEEVEEYATIKKALVLMTRWAGTMPILNMVSDALSEQHSIMATPAPAPNEKEKETPRSHSSISSPPPLSSGSTLSSIDTPPSQFEPLTRISTFQSDPNIITTSLVSSPDPSINYSENKMVRSVQKKVERNINKETYDQAVKVGMERIQDVRVKFETAKFKDLSKLKDIGSKRRPWGSFSKKEKDREQLQLEGGPEKLMLEAPEEKLLIEGKEEEMLLEEGPKMLLLETASSDMDGGTIGKEARV